MKILVACFPKSGSTFLSTLISSLDGFSAASWVPDYGHREQELEEALIAAPGDTPHQVAQHHVRASGPTISMLERQAVEPIVLVRNLFDCAVSLAEHTKRESHEYPMAFLEPEIATADFHRRLGAIIDLAMPWYINFYASWSHFRPDRIVRYEDIVNTTHAQRARQFAQFGIPVSEFELSRIVGNISPQKSRFNVGVSGRGERLLSPEQKARLRAMCAHYRSTDFSMIGIDATNELMREKRSTSRR